MPVSLMFPMISAGGIIITYLVSRFFYKEKPIINTVEIITEKIVKDPYTEYVYIEQQNKIQEQEKDSSKKEQECIPEIQTEIQTKIQKEMVEKEVYKIPIIVYIIIFLLILIIVILIIKLHKKICRIKDLSSIVEPMSK